MTSVRYDLAKDLFESVMNDTSHFFERTKTGRTGLSDQDKPWIQHSIGFQFLVELLLIEFDARTLLTRITNVLDHDVKTLIRLPLAVAQIRTSILIMKF